MSGQDLPDVAQGVQPYAMFHGGKLDVVNTSNGSLLIQIPLVSYPQKGSLALSFSVVYSPFAFQNVVTCDSAPEGGPKPVRAGCAGVVSFMPMGGGSGYIYGPHLVVDQALSAGGVSVADPDTLAFEPEWWGRYYTLASDNSQHPLGRLADGSGFRSVDGSGFLFVPSSISSYPAHLGSSVGKFNGDLTRVVSPTQGTITDSHGTVYTDTSITDVNGNTIQLLAGAAVVDSVNRKVPLPPAQPATCPFVQGSTVQASAPGQAWTVPSAGPGGSSTFTFCYAKILIHTHMVGASNGGQQQQVNTSKTMLQSIVLPNGTFWGFIYDSADPNASNYGSLPGTGIANLTDLVFPTGGSVHYEWSNAPGRCDNNRITGLNPGGVSVTSQIASVATRTEKDARGNNLGTWTYSTSGNTLDAQTASPNAFLLTPTHAEVDTYASDGTFCGIAATGKVIYSDTSSNSAALKTDATTYVRHTVPGYPETPYQVASQMTTTLDDGSSSTVLLQTDSGLAFQERATNQNTFVDWRTVVGGQTYFLPLGLTTSKTYQNFDGSVLKKETTGYLWQTANSYLSANLISLPSSVVTYDGTTRKAEIDLTYDQPSLSFGGVRGLLTKASTWLDKGSTVSSDTFTGWTSDGMRSFVIDAEGAGGNSAHLRTSTGHTVDYAYGDCNGSTITDTYNVLGHHTSGQYDCNSGLVTTVTDANTKSTSFTYDSSNRITLSKGPMMTLSNGQTAQPSTSLTFLDSSDQVQETVAASPDPDRNVMVQFDGFGRPTQTKTSSSSGSVIVDQTYDFEGRLDSVSNPYYTTADPTYAIKVTTFDALSRPTALTNLADRSSKTWMYVGATTKFADEAGVSSSRMTDALGRMTTIIEAGSLQTKYSYSALSNLENVIQFGVSGEARRSRIFEYDSASRLLWSRNPETGFICYGHGDGSEAGCHSDGYDASGNLRFKTDARGITTSYTYDGLNRIKHRTFVSASGSSVLSPNVDYAYDGLMTDGSQAQYVTNAIGQLTNVVAGTARRVYSYDALERLTFTDGCYNGSFYNCRTGQEYDLSGNVTKVRHSDGTYVDQVYDSAGQLQSSTTENYFHPHTPITLLQSAKYLADGSPSVLVFGDSAFGQTFTKNPHLQVETAGALSPLLPFAGTLMSSKYCYQGFKGGADCEHSGANNGNISAILDSRQPALNQSFSYDALNRLSTFALAGAVKESYGMDSYGNMIINPVSGPLPFDASNQRNDLTCPDSVGSYYDPAGNVRCGKDQYGGDFIITSDAENRVAYMNTLPTAGNADMAFINYVYDGDGRRVKKWAGPNTETDYKLFAGITLSEFTSGIGETNYFYVNGQRVARIPGNDHRLHVTGTFTSNGNEIGSDLAVPPEPNGSQYNIHPGDMLCFRQYNKGGGIGGPGIGYADGGASIWHLYDTAGQMLNQFGAQDVWTHRCADISEGGAHGGPVGWFSMLTDVSTPGGSTWHIYYADMTISSTDGTVRQVNLDSIQQGGRQGGHWDADKAPIAFTETVRAEDDLTNNIQGATIHYYLEDHLGTTQMELSAAGYPVWRGQFSPYGGEMKNGVTIAPDAPDGSDNHYKFTGKERDTESGLDYFGARYYASSTGRWMSPDWAAKAQPVPYAKLENPQTLNLYSYVGNNPLSRFDPDGHEVDLGTNADKGKKLILDNVNKKERSLVSSVTDAKTGKTSLQIDAKAAAAFKGTHTEGFNMLSQAISSDKVIQVNVVDPKTMITGPDGVSSAISSPTWGGGASAPTANGAIVTVSSGGGADVLGQSGVMISSPASIVMGHEFFGHGLGYISVGHDGTESHAIGVENQLREEQGLPLREPHP